MKKRKFDMGKKLVEEMTQHTGMFSPVMDEATDYIICPRDFRSIRERAYLVRHGIDVSSGYMDCLVDAGSREEESFRIPAYQSWIRYKGESKPVTAKDIRADLRTLSGLPNGGE